MNYERINILKDSGLQYAAEKPRNKHIKGIYNQLISQISNKLDIDCNRAWNKFPREAQNEITTPNLIEAFYTPYCCVKLLVHRTNYIIQLTVTDQSFNAGTGINSTALLRIAFEVTAYEQQGFIIQDALEIKVNNQIAHIYKQKVDERIDRQNKDYFNKKMKVEG